jgi:hypothetical protein
VADARVSALIRRINELVEADTGSRSLAVGDQITRRVTRSDQRRLRLLVDNLDIPARLAPGPGEKDRRPRIRAALIETVAGCAGVLEPQEPAEESLYPYGRSRFETANSRLYAQYETPRLVAELRPDGQSDDGRMAGEGRVLMVQAAVDELMAASAVPNVERPFVAGRITDEADLQFDALDTVTGDPERYGTDIGKVAVSMAHQQEPMARFASGHDPALARPQAQPRDSAPTTNRPTTNPDPKRPTLDR